MESKKYKYDVKKSSKKYRDLYITGSKSEVVKYTERICLLCDRPFMSTGNRRCESCNEHSFCEYESNVSLFVRC